MTERAAAVSLIGVLVVLIGGWFFLSSPSGAQAFDDVSAWLDQPGSADLVLLFASLLTTALTFGALGVGARLHAGARAWVRTHTSWYLAAGAALLSFDVTCALLQVAAPADVSDTLDTASRLVFWATIIMTIGYVLYAARRWSLDHGSPATWAVTPLIFQVWILLSYALAAVVWLWAFTRIPWPT